MQGQHIMQGQHEFFDFSKTMAPHASAIYRQVVPAYLTTHRYKGDPGKAHVLDKHFGIDGYVRTAPGMMWTFQEKFRRFDTQRRLRGVPPFRDFTLEVMNNPHDPKAYGEMYHLAAQWYFYGWASEDMQGFDAWFFMNVPAFCALCADMGGAANLSRTLQGENKLNRPRNSRASFLTFPAIGLRSCFYDSFGIVPEDIAAKDEADQIDTALNPWE